MPRREVDVLSYDLTLTLNEDIEEILFFHAQT